MHHTDVLRALHDPLNSSSRLILAHWGADAADACVSLWPYRFTQCDGLNTPFTLEVTCLGTAACPTPAALLGHALGLGVSTGVASRRWVAGIIETARIGDAIGGLVPVHLQLRSVLSLLGKRWTSRVFQDKTVPQIVATILEEHRRADPALAATFDYVTRFNAAQAHPARAYCVQYNETDAQFIQRLLAEDGIGYRFECEAPDAGAPARHRLCLFDSPDGIAPSARTLHCRAQAPMVGDEERTLLAWGEQRALMARATERVRHYPHADGTWAGEDHTPPGAATARATASLSDYRALPPPLADTHNGLDRQARHRQLAREASAECFLGEGRLRDLRTGSGFLLVDQAGPSGDLHGPADFIVTGQRWTVTNNLPDGSASDDLAQRLQEVNEGYDIGRRLGNTGVSAALVELGLGTMLSYQHGGASAAVYRGSDGSMTVQMVSPPDDATKAANREKLNGFDNPFMAGD